MSGNLRGNFLTHTERQQQQLQRMRQQGLVIGLAVVASGLAQS